MLKPLVTMREALTDPALLGEALPGLSWMPWRILLIASMGEALTCGERLMFERLTGREQEPGEPVEEFWGIVGRRGGKTRAAGTLASYIGGLCEHDYLAPGERAVLPILAASTSQALRAFIQARGIIQHSPVLRAALDGEPTADTIRLKTGVDIEVKPANFRTIRGITAPAVVADEVAFWLVEGTSNADSEILDAVRPALATTGGPLFVISSPHAKRGEVYNAWRKFYGPAGDPKVLVAKGPSRVFNSELKQSVVDRAYERDAAVAAAEYGGEFRQDVEAFVARETVEACVMTGHVETAPAYGVRYLAFVDPSGGGADGFTLGIGHQVGDRVVIDALRERRPPFSSEAVVEEYAGLLKRYWLTKVTGDRYAGIWPREAFKRHGIEYELAEQPKSALYQGLLPALNSQRVDLPDHPKLVDQIAGLERRVARGGRESIDHPPHGHDDLANAVAGVVARLVLTTPVPTAESRAFSWM